MELEHLETHGFKKEKKKKNLNLSLQSYTNLN